jgi:hypothetical protein
MQFRTPVLHDKEWSRTMANARERKGERAAAAARRRTRGGGMANAWARDRGIFSISALINE